MAIHSNETSTIGRRVLCEKRGVGRPLALCLIEEARRQGPWDLIEQARIVREGLFGRKVRFCCIVPGKLGQCSEDCKWCAQSAHAQGGGVTPSRSSQEEMLKAVCDAHDIGAGQIGVVNSGRGPSQKDIHEVEILYRTLGENAALAENIGLCASLGELTDDQAAQLKAAGVKRYHHNLETSKNFYAQMVSTHDYQARLDTLETVKQAGLSLCCGGLFGLGESWEDRLDLAELLRDVVRPDTVPLNFLVPAAGTAMENRTVLPPQEILTIIAVYRLMLPTVDINIAGGRGHLHDLQCMAFQAGATSCMIGNYLTTTGRSLEEDLQMIDDLGLEVVKTHGKPTFHPPLE